MIRFTLAATLTLAALITGLAATPPATAAVGTYTLMIGDSLTARGEDNIRAIRSGWDIDGQPSTRPNSLLTRIDEGVARHGGVHPATIVVALGTNISYDWSGPDYGQVRTRLPNTRIVFVTPVRDPRVVGWDYVAYVDRYRYHMHKLAIRDDRTCVALWAEAVQQNWGLLSADGIHASPAGEDRWATEVVTGKDSCVRTEP